MYVIKGANVNDIFVPAMQAIKSLGKEVSPRGMRTLEMPQPVTTTYLYPRERVLLISERDANPFFHLFESLWILAGRNDVEWLSQFNSRMREYSDDGKTYNAPYGYRLRAEFGFDQIQNVIELLKTDPSTRRAVLQIWNCKKDLKESLDIPCNDLVMFKVRDNKLNMTVCNRSNDAIWGAYGANVVQFSMLQEYIANKIGMDVGVYNQVSDSLHVYPDNPKWKVLSELPYRDNDFYKYDIQPYPLGADHPLWDVDLKLFMEQAAPSYVGYIDWQKYHTSFFRYVAIPMFKSWYHYKHFGKGLIQAETIRATDWKAAAIQWLRKREKKDGE